MTWTGKKCPACKGIGERYHAGRDCDAACPDCGGTGDEFVPDPELPPDPGGYPASVYPPAPVTVWINEAPDNWAKPCDDPDCNGSCLRPSAILVNGKVQNPTHDWDIRDKLRDQMNNGGC